MENMESFDFSDPSKSVDYITELLTDVADKSKIKTIKHNSKPNDDPPWFDKECTKLKNKIRELGKKRKRFPQNSKKKYAQN